MPPIFILGLTQRTGTTWLSKCFHLHPHCTGTTIHEDYLLYYSDNLKTYTDLVAGRWSPWVPKKDSREILMQTLGNSLFNLILEKTPDLDTSRKHIVLRTPSVRNIGLLHHFFPGAKAVVLTRDGRSVVESHTNGFGTSFITCAKQFKRASKELSRFLSSNPNSHLVKVVRYENLVGNFREEMESLFRFLEIDETIYDWDAAEKIPVYGSSFFGLKNGAVHWAGVEKNKDFNPLERHQNWSWLKKLIYFLMAGKTNGC